MRPPGTNRGKENEIANLETAHDKVSHKVPYLHTLRHSPPSSTRVHGTEEITGVMLKDS